MKILLTARHHEASAARQRLKLKEVEYLLGRHRDDRRRHLFIQLARALLLPGSGLIPYPGPLLAKLIAQWFELIEQKSGNFLIHESFPGNGSERLLLVSCPNEPFIVESILALQCQEMPFQLLAHPVLIIGREGHVITYLEESGRRGEQELVIVIRLEFHEQKRSTSFIRDIHKVLTAVLQVQQSGNELGERLQAQKGIASLHEWWGFVDWLKGRAFIPFHYRCLSARQADDFRPPRNSAMAAGIGMDIQLAREQQQHAAAAEVWRSIFSRDSAVIVQQVPLISPLLRCQPLTYIGFREPLEEGGWQEHMFLGLFREPELNGLACHVPELCDKIRSTVLATGASRNSYDYVHLQELFNLFPKVELFFLGSEQLHFLAQSLCRYLYRPESIKLLFLASPSPTQISALIIVPKAQFKEAIAQRLQNELCTLCHFHLLNSRKIIFGGAYVGVQLILLPEQEKISIDVAALEKGLNRIARPWKLRLRLLLERALGKETAGKLWKKYAAVFSDDYQAAIAPVHAIRDILHMQQVLKNAAPCIELLKPGHGYHHYRLHFYSLQEHYLDVYLPVLKNLNLRVIDQVQFASEVDGRDVFIKSFSVETASTQYQTLHLLKTEILETIREVMDGRLESDELNRLVVLNGMSWKEIDVLRGYRNYYFQLGHQAVLSSFHRALLNNPQAACYLYQYFEARFRPVSAWEDPAVREEQALFPLRMQLLESFAGVTDINDDRILRTLFNLIDATVRSNFHVRRDLQDYFIAFKINSLGIIDMPAPRPQFEIYVHAADMEGIHLRGGKIARGGIRWSERPDDFRTEILGLMQTQMSKNALIVPTGAKGGFVVKETAVRENPAQAGKNAYVKLIRGFLDLTDNYAQQQVVRLPGIVAYDDEDPYFVVAADKGTAKFPDLANAVAAEYHFWLQDGFASGGSRGYNHKTLGITARGAWECVKRHFRELGRDIQSQPFTVIGIGSMDGDVFGNGMLLSRCISLRAAFSGWHIFIDPEPDQEKSFDERKRLFELPGSSWDDYDRDLISRGGGVYRRDAKDIPISDELRKWLGIRYRSLDGETLVRHLLTASADLLWLGGVGTYVKASTEKHEDVGDRSNDNVRVDASDLKVSVVGEGANLGFTQKARSEFSLAGGHINTDAIDNSAGVDISDHEVNLKILLTALHKQGVIDDCQQVFDSVTDEICRLVLANNYTQSQCISLDQIRCENDLNSYLGLAERLQGSGLLDRDVESFPLAREVLARQNQDLTRPELAVLLAGSKMLLSQMLLEQHELVSQDYCRFYLQAYFPGELRDQYADYFLAHPLANEIKAAIISNRIIDQAGCLFCNLDAEAGAADLTDCVSSYLTFDQVLDAATFRQSVYALDNRVAASLQYRLLLKLEQVLLEFSRWALLHNEKIQPDEQTITCYKRYLLEYRDYFQQHEGVEANADYKERLTAYREQKIPGQLAAQMLFIDSLSDFPLLVKLSMGLDEPFEQVLKTFNDLTRYLELQQVNEKLAQFPVHDQWQRRVLNDLRVNLKNTIGRLIEEILLSDVHDCEAYFVRPDCKAKIQHYRRLFREASHAPSGSLLPFIALHHELENLLARCC